MFGLKKKQKRPRCFRILYWSSRKKGDISEPYGQEDCQDIVQLKKSARRLWESGDIYRIELWHRLDVREREIIVEDYHGNPAHLEQRNAKMEGK